MRCVGRVACALLFAASAASAQLKETIEVHLVEVPVTVLDRAGNPVRGLKASNFELFDQGKKREVSTFDMIDFASPAVMKTASLLNPAARRTFLLLFDLSFSSPVSRAKAQEAARNFIARSMGRRDLAAVGTIDVDRGFRIITSFTTDRTLLKSAIASPQTFVSSDPLRIAGSTVFEAPAQLPQVGGVGRNADGNTADDLTADIARGEKRLNDAYNRSRVERQLRLLSTVARTLRMLPGRKQIILMSEGFDARLVQGRDARASAEERDDMEQLTTGMVWRVDPDARYGSSTTMTVLEEMARAFRGSDVILHAVDIQGVRVQNDQNGSLINSNESLHLLAAPTGGEVFKNSNDVNFDLDKMLRRQEVVYVLGFRAPSSNDGRFHELKVRLMNVPGGRVFNRAGYFESGAQSALERELTNAEIILNDIPQSGVGIATLAASFPTSGPKSQVPVIIDIAGTDLLKDAPTKDVAAEIYVYAFDDEGVVRDRMYQRISVDSEKVADRLRATGIKYYTTLSLGPGKYAVKTLVRIVANDRKGYARADIDVPGLNDVQLLPPLFIDDPARWVIVHGGSHDATNAPYPFHINGEPFIPSASVRVTNGHPRKFALFVLNASADELAWETAVTDALGHPNGSPALLTRLQGPDMTKLVFEYAPGELGSATLDVAVHKKGSSDMRKSSVPLLVQR